jgi:hypothetical protein
MQRKKYTEEQIIQGAQRGRGRGVGCRSQSQVRDE